MHELRIEDRRGQFVDLVRRLVRPGYAAIGIAGRCSGFDEFCHGIASELNVELDRRAKTRADVGSRLELDLVGGAGFGILREDNLKLLESLREAKELADAAGDNATGGLLDDWTDQAEKRGWFLFEATRSA